MILHKAVSLARGAVVVLSVGLPLALIASTVVARTGPPGVDLTVRRARVRCDRALPAS